MGFVDLKLKEIKKQMEEIELKRINEKFQEIKKIDVLRINVSYPTMEELNKDKPKYEIKFNKVYYDNKNKLDEIKKLKEFILRVEKYLEKEIKKQKIEDIKK